MKNILIICALIVTVFSCKNAVAASDLRLWYDKPANYFEETLVLGNGKHGASVFGGVYSDKIFLNDATLWSGEPVDPHMNPDAHEVIPEIREALFREDYRKAEQLNRNVQGEFSQSYAPLGTMYIEFPNQGNYQNYHRELNISEATATVSYDLGDVHYTREYFVSHPDQVMVIKLSSSKKGALDFSVKFESLLKYSSSSVEDILQINGYAPYHVTPDYWNDNDPVRFDENRGTRFSTYFKINNKGGKVDVSNGELKVSNANEAIIFVSMATSFNGFDKDPVKDGMDNKAIAEQQLINASSKSYNKLMGSHLSDYQAFFNRLSLDLTDNNIPDLPTDERLKRYSEGADDKNLEMLYFQFGRYLLISSSRTEGVPANLQGIWNPYIRPPWSSNYTMNINVEENYWLAESANLSEMHRPFLTFIGNLAQTGKITAKTFYGVDKGWAACHNSDIWAMSNPVGDYGKGEPMWACWNMSGTWVVTHLWDHFLYTGDIDFLKNYAYPLMKGAAAFCFEWLVEDKQGYLVTAPSTSPENTYITPDGFRGATLYGATADLAMIRECFDQTIRASEILKVDVALRDSLKEAIKRLYPYQIGEEGNLQEWYYDWEDADPLHRHQTHLYGLHPGRHISPEKTPKLAMACLKTLEIKGDESTGWSKGWRINLWARLKNGNQAYKMYRELLTYVEPDGAQSVNYGGGGGTYPNLFDAHPPFQIDGNFGGAAGVIEMLLQSSEDEIFLLPALPDAWPSGTVKGICARGGFEISMKWLNGQLSSVEVLSEYGGKCKLNYNKKTTNLNTTKGKVYKLDANLKLKKLN
ncbi:MAG: glycoside hydrolase family 95 protein [Prolixibacteraceae bacterium]|nr:glycoside hydrolase family 95 protein [Prolixibacteraceae bacterium]